MIGCFKISPIFWGRSRRSRIEVYYSPAGHTIEAKNWTVCSEQPRVSLQAPHAASNNLPANGNTPHRQRTSVIQHNGDEPDVFEWAVRHWREAEQQGWCQEGASPQCAQQQRRARGGRRGGSVVASRGAGGRYKPAHARLFTSSSRDIHMLAHGFASLSWRSVDKLCQSALDRIRHRF